MKPKSELKFRPLRPDEIEVRQGRTGNGFIDLLLYKTARTDTNLLNETVGAENWINDVRIINGNLWAGIGIWNSERNEYSWKWSVGTESNVEKIKGEDSDAFKRAGYRWGIGIELYTAPSLTIWEKKGHYTPKNDGKGTWDSFKVATIEYDGLGNISKVSIVNTNTNRVVVAVGYAGADEIKEAIKDEKARKEEIIKALKGEES